MYTDFDRSGHPVSHAKPNSSRKRKRRKNKGRSRLVKSILFLIAMILFLGNFGPWSLQLLRTATSGGEIDISGEVVQGQVPTFMQGDPRWSSRPYGDSTMKISGCGPTCLSMVYCALTGDDRWDPYSLAHEAEMQGYYVEGSGTAWVMMTELAEKIGLSPRHIPFDADSIKKSLENGMPIICAMGPGDFTTEGHFIVLADLADNGNVIVRDPNSKINGMRSWPLDILMPQMKNLWGYEM